MLSSWYFYHRSKAFIDDVLKKIFDIEDIWCRYEWQSRGSPHMHGVLWLKNGPSLNSEIPSADKLEEMRKFYKNYSFAWNVITPTEKIHPSELRFSEIKAELKEHDLINILNWVQRHTKCGGHSLRLDKKTKQFKCRYKFPQKLQSDSSIEENNGMYQFCPARNDEYITRYHPLISLIWRANTDVSAIVGINGILHYIAKYVAKGEYASCSFVEILKGSCSKLSSNSPAKKAIINLFTSLLSERDYSAQEVSHILMGYDMFICSRNFVTVNLSDTTWSKIQVNY